MLSALDTKYFDRLKPLGDVLGEDNFIYFLSVWALTYAECINKSAYLGQYENREELSRRVQIKERSTKNTIAALLAVLDEDHPDVTFNFGLTPEDLEHNARWSQICCILDIMQEKLKEVELGIREFERQVTIPVLIFSDGQPSTPVFLGPYLRGCARYLSSIKPEFRFGGSNGQLTALQHAGVKDVKALAEAWLKKVQKIHAALEKTAIVYPVAKISLAPHGPSNEATLLTSISIASRLKALAECFSGHAHRKILINLAQADAGVFFGQASAFFSTSLNGLQAGLHNQTACNSQHQQSIFGRHLVETMAYLFLGVSTLVEGMHKSIYSPKAVLEELKANPRCLSELLVHYMLVAEGRNDPYQEIKNIVMDFDKAVKRMGEWDILGVP